MKKLILTPKKDTFTICLPPDWVGKPMVCILKTPYEQFEDEVISQVSDVAISYQAERHHWARRGRRYLLRKRRVASKANAGRLRSDA